jgi:hypothetical protein
VIILLCRSYQSRLAEEVLSLNLKLSFAAVWRVAWCAIRACRNSDPIALWHRTYSGEMCPQRDFYFMRICEVM